MEVAELIEEEHAVIGQKGTQQEQYLPQSHSQRDRLKVQLRPLAFYRTKGTFYT